MKANAGFIVLLLSCRVGDAYVPDENDVRAYAVARCGAVQSCCNVAAESDCVESLVSMVLDAETTLSGDLSFSEECMKDLLEYSENIGCDRETVDSPSCRLAIGNGDYGDECQNLDDNLGFYITICREGLQCYSGRCVDDPFSATQTAGLAENCSAFISCGFGLYCGVDSTCYERSPAGGACTEPAGCESGFYCAGYLDEPNAQGTCEEWLGIGAACDSRYLTACGYHPMDGRTRLSMCEEGICVFPQGSPICDDVPR